MIKVFNDYCLTSELDVELPVGKTSDDIKDIGFKWGRGSIEFKDGTCMDGLEEDDGFDVETTKRPSLIRVTDKEFDHLCEFEVNQ